MTDVLAIISGYDLPALLIRHIEGESSNSSNALTFRHLCQMSYTRSPRVRTNSDSEHAKPANTPKPDYLHDFFRVCPLSAIQPPFYRYGSAQQTGAASASY